MDKKTIHFIENNLLSNIEEIQSTYGYGECAALRLAYLNCIIYL
jgi:hypothetical protein